MGLGKTAQSISVLAWQRQYGGTRGPFLVIAPLTTLGHWQREIETWTDMVRMRACACLPACFVCVRVRVCVGRVTSAAAACVRAAGALQAPTPNPPPLCCQQNCVVYAGGAADRSVIQKHELYFRCARRWGGRLEGDACTHAAAALAAAVAPGAAHTPSLHAPAPTPLRAPRPPSTHQRRTARRRRAAQAQRRAFFV